MFETPEKEKKIAFFFVQTQTSVEEEASDREKKKSEFLFAPEERSEKSEFVEFSLTSSAESSIVFDTIFLFC